MADLVLAILHHLLAFALAAVLAFEIAMIRAGMRAAELRRTAMVDRHYGGLAVLLLLVGFGRAIYAAKGWAYYSVNAMFWAKMATFLLIALLSIGPTVALLRWRRAAG